MKICKILIVILFSTTFCSSPRNQVDCPNTPKLLGRVNDYSDILTDEEEQNLTTILARLEKDIGSQMGILTIDTLNGELIEEYSLRVANCWALGRKNYNDGLLITVALKDRKMRIEVGYGLEKIVKDEIARNIIVNEIVPKFKQEKYFNGLLAATNKIDSLIRTNIKLVGEQP